MYSHFNKPIRTYGKEKFRKAIISKPKLVNSILGDVDNKNSVSLNEKANEFETKEIVDNSMYYDPFETTFDRLVKNARIQPKSPKTHNDTALFTSSNNSYICNYNKSGVHVDKPLSQESSNFNIKSVSNKSKFKQKATDKNRKLRVIKKTLVKKKKPGFQNSGQFKVHQDSFHTFKTNKIRNKEKIKSHNLGIESSNISYGTSTAEVKDCKMPRKIDFNETPPLWHTIDNDEVASAESMNNMQIKQCSVILNKSVVLKWNHKLKNCSPKETIKCDAKIDEIDINNLENKKSTMKQCFVKIEQLEVDSFLKQFSSRKKHISVVSSTPISKPLRLSNLIALSPIPIKYSEEIKNSDRQASTDNTTIHENNKVSLQPHGTESDLYSKLDRTEKSEIEEEAEVLSICETHLPNFSKCNFIKSENVNGRSIDPLSISEYNINKIFDEQELLMHGQSAKSNVMNKINKSSMSLELHSISNTEKKKQHLNFSVDTNRSRSLFDDSHESIENILFSNNVINNEREEFISSVILGTESEISNNEMSFDSIKLNRKSILNINTYKRVTFDKTQEEVSNVLCLNSLVSLNDVENKLNVKKSDFENVDTLNVVEHTPKKKSDALSINNSIMATINSYNIAPSYTILKQLQDPIRITARRKYTKWGHKLHSIAEDYKNSIDLKEKRTSSRNASKSRETVLSQRILTSLENMMEESVNNTSVAIEKPIFLKPGKSWARSLSILNNVHSESNLEKLSVGKGQKWSYSVRDVLNMQKQGIIQSCIKGNVCNKELQHDETINKSEEELVNDKGRTCDSTNLIRVSRRISVRVVPIHKTVKSIEDAPFLEAYGIVPIKRQSVTLLNNPETYSTSNVQIDNVDGQIIDEHVVSATKEVILQRCLQTDYIPFSTYFSDLYLKYCQKIGEGVYGEVFLYEQENTKSVIKIIPIEGSEYVNGEPQKKFHEILSEIVIAMELHNLRFNTKYNTDGFVEVKNIKCIKGRYPQKLIELWNIYDEEKRSENDCPSMFDDEQLYILLELGHGGQDLEAFIFNTAEEVHILFIQAALALAVAEKAVQFEHRDLHWGNVLISSTNESCIHYKLGEKNIELISKGVKVSIIDFTLSRVTYQGCSVFNDLASDPTLFTAQGEYQFEIYRLMRDKVKNNWQKFEPYTNILWLHYTLDKMITAVRYRKKNLKIHKNGVAKLNELKSIILAYSSAFDFVTNCDKIVNLLCINSESELALI